jgi:nitrogenase-stabilizing/protective protein
MGQYLATEDFEDIPDRVIAARCRTFLERAYEDFVTSNPLKERVFKVLKDHDPSRPVKPGEAFVGLDEIMAPIPMKD